jgi:hypothetical protein
LLPLWSGYQINAAAAEDIKACLMVVIFIPLIPWRYVFAGYVLKHGYRWKQAVMRPHSLAIAPVSRQEMDVRRFRFER